MNLYFAINLPILFGLVVARPTLFNTILFQLAYQTYHADLNQGNRNLNYSEHTTTNKPKRSDWKNYILACLTSISLSLLARNLTAGLIMKVTTGGSLVLLNALLTYLATSTGSVFNTFLMRDAEL